MLFAIAGALTISIGLAHSYLGERYLIGRLLKRPDLPRLFGNDVFTRQTLRFAWHLTTLAWLGSAAIFFAIGSRPLDLTGVVTARLLALHFMLSALLALIATRAKHLSWVVFLAIALCAWLASSR